MTELREKLYPTIWLKWCEVKYSEIVTTVNAVPCCQSGDELQEVCSYLSHDSSKQENWKPLRGFKNVGDVPLEQAPHGSCCKDSSCQQHTHRSSKSHPALTADRNQSPSPSRQSGMHRDPSVPIQSNPSHDLTRCFAQMKRRNVYRELSNGSLRWRRKYR